MAKRFTDSEKWRKPWFRKLPAPYREFWGYLLDECDQAGIWYVDIEAAQFCLGAEIDTRAAIELFDKQIVVFSDGSRWFIKDFIRFQYGKLSPAVPFQANIIALLKSYDLEASLTPTLGASIAPSPKEKEKDKAKAKAFAVHRELPTKPTTTEQPKERTAFQVFMDRILKDFLMIDPANKRAVTAAYRRFGRAGKDIMAFANDDPEKAYQGVDAIAVYMQGRGLTWTFDTAAKWFPDWMSGGLKDAQKARR